MNTNKTLKTKIQPISRISSTTAVSQPLTSFDNTFYKIISLTKPSFVRSSCKNWSSFVRSWPGLVIWSRTSN